MKLGNLGNQVVVHLQLKSWCTGGMLGHIIHMWWWMRMHVLWCTIFKKKFLLFFSANLPLKVTQPQSFLELKWFELDHVIVCALNHQASVNQVTNGITLSYFLPLPTSLLLHSTLHPPSYSSYAWNLNCIFWFPLYEPYEHGNLHLHQMCLSISKWICKGR
jgi:hypothetical protein